MDKKVLPAVKMGICLSPIFMFFILLYNHLKMMKISKTEFFYHTIDPRYGQKSAASSKNGNFFVTDFFFFFFILLYNDLKMMKNDENRILLSHL